MSLLLRLCKLSACGILNLDFRPQAALRSLLFARMLTRVIMIFAHIDPLPLGEEGWGFYIFVIGEVRLQPP